ncbi:MAG: DUF1844 domain-containing protein [Candidatus Methylomirabilales bacterium]
MPNKAPGEEEEPSFRVTDRRGVRPESSEEPAQASRASSEGQSDPRGSPTAETPPTEEAGREQGVLLLPIPDLVGIFIAELHTRALMHMGLIPNPATRLVAKDLPQARLAIDCAAALIEQLGPSVAPAEREELEWLLADLRLKFVQQSGG